MIKQILQALGHFLSYLFPLKMPIFMRAFCSHLYTGFARRRFAGFGVGSLIGYPVSDIAGASCIHVGRHIREKWSALCGKEVWSSMQEGEVFGVSL